MQRRARVMAGAAALGFAAVLGAGPSAMAAQPAQPEPLAGTFYVYEHDDFNGGSARFTSTDTNLSNNSWIGSPGRIINNNISSMKNQTDRDIVMYDTAGTCAGDAYLARKHSEDKDLTNNGFDNKASCIRFG